MYDNGGLIQAACLFSEGKGKALTLVDLICFAWRLVFAGRAGSTLQRGSQMPMNSLQISLVN